MGHAAPRCHRRHCRQVAFHSRFRESRTSVHLFHRLGTNETSLRWRPPASSSLGSSTKSSGKQRTCQPKSGYENGECARRLSHKRSTSGCWSSDRRWQHLFGAGMNVQLYKLLRALTEEKGALAAPLSVSLTLLERRRHQWHVSDSNGAEQQMFLAIEVENMPIGFLRPGRVPIQRHS